ncbi:MAG TPA: glucokinase [Pseudomonadota bacterium]|nr:glucokinase [Pseudomonadota bacterium]
MTLLAGDLGGTKTLLALFDDAGTLLHKQRFASQQHPDLESMVTAFLAATAKDLHPQVMALGVAGPVAKHAGFETCDVTNLPYRIDGRSIAARFGFASVRLVNDFYAVAAAVSVLARGGSFPGLSLCSLHPLAHAEPGSPIAVLGAGTGLGEALIAFHGDVPVILPTEGGHTDFAPHDDLEVQLWRYLQRRHPDHVSQERLVCGPGIATLYAFFRDERIGTESPQVAAELACCDDPARVISRHALAKTDPLCEQVMDRFVMLYGAEAGNLALKSLARGGVYLAGGIAAKNLPLFTTGLFVSHFARKGRFSGLLSSIPIHVVQGEEIGLFGALTIAKSIQQGQIRSS